MSITADTSLQVQLAELKPISLESVLKIGSVTMFIDYLMVLEVLCIIESVERGVMLCGMWNFWLKHQFRPFSARGHNRIHTFSSLHTPYTEIHLTTEILIPM